MEYQKKNQLREPCEVLSCVVSPEQKICTDGICIDMPIAMIQHHCAILFVESRTIEYINLNTSTRQAHVNITKCSRSELNHVEYPGGNEYLGIVLWSLGSNVVFFTIIGIIAYIHRWLFLVREKYHKDNHYIKIRGRLNEMPEELTSNEMTPGLHHPGFDSGFARVFARMTSELRSDHRFDQRCYNFWFLDTALRHNWQKFVLFLVLLFGVVWFGIGIYQMNRQRNNELREPCKIISCVVPTGQKICTDGVCIDAPIAVIQHYCTILFIRSQTVEHINLNIATREAHMDVTECSRNELNPMDYPKENFNRLDLEVAGFVVGSVSMFVLLMGIIVYIYGWIDSLEKKYYQKIGSYPKIRRGRSNSF
jgi:hypothetical protein